MLGTPRRRVGHRRSHETGWTSPVRELRQAENFAPRSVHNHRDVQLIGVLHLNGQGPRAANRAGLQPTLAGRR